MSKTSKEKDEEKGRKAYLSDGSLFGGPGNNVGYPSQGKRGSSVDTTDWKDDTHIRLALSCQRYGTMSGGKLTSDTQERVLNVVVCRDDETDQETESSDSGSDGQVVSSVLEVIGRIGKDDDEDDGDLRILKRKRD